MRNAAINAGLVLAALTLCAYLLEIFIEFAQPIAAAYDYSPHTDFRLRPNQQFRFQTEEFDTTVTINADGLRDQSIDLSRPCRVLLLGDSFTFGHGVSDDQTFEYLLEQRLESLYPERFTLINSGHNGYDTRREAAFLEHYGGRYSPNVIAIFFSLNDVLANSGEHVWSPISTNIVLRHLPFKGVAALIHYLLQNPGELLFKLGFDVGYEKTDHLRCLRDGECPEAWEATRTAVAGIKREADEIGARVIFVNIPLLEQVSANAASGTREPDRASRGLHRISEALGITFADFALAPGLARRFYYGRDGHLTPEAHRLLAEFLFPLISDPALCPAQS